MFYAILPVLTYLLTVVYVVYCVNRSGMLYIILVLSVFVIGD